MQHHITKTDNWPHILIFFDDTINSAFYREVILYLFVWHLNKDETVRGYLQQDDATTYTTHVSVTLLRRGRNNFKEHLATTDVRCYTSNCCLWGPTKGPVYKDNSRAPIHHEGNHRKFHHKHPSSWIVASLCKRDKTCRCLSPVELSLFANKTRRVDACLKLNCRESLEQDKTCRCLSPVELSWVFANEIRRVDASLQMNCRESLQTR
jgi:hypothetical protein